PDGAQRTRSEVVDPGYRGCRGRGAPRQLVGGDVIRAPKQPAPPAVESWRRRGVVTTHSVVLLGNPNVGKTTLFNALTGENARVGNYPGVTVERRVGRWPLSNETVELVDVPGTYSLSARSTEEQVALEAALGF